VTLPEAEELAVQFTTEKDTAESLMKELLQIMLHLTVYRTQTHPNVHKLPTLILKKIKIHLVEQEE